MISNVIEAVLSSSDPLYGMQRLVGPILDNYREYRWSVHGIGMMRTYLDDARRFRLNLWHPCLLNPGISTMHTHPWPFTSHIIAGRMTNYRFHRCTKNSVGAILFNEGRITCGPGFDGMNGDPEVVTLHRREPEVYTPGQTYVQQPHEIHDTNAEPGSITLIERGPEIEGCEASVFWPVGTKWGDASREFNWQDADRTIRAARRQLQLAQDDGA